MDAKALLSLAEIVDLGSFSRAARHLNVSQPSLTQAIKYLESVVGEPVLLRGRFGAVPTRIGEKLAREGRIIRSALGEASVSVKHWRAERKERLRVGTGHLFSRSVMQDFTRTVLEENWPVSLEIRTGNVSSQFELLSTDQIDVALAPYESSHADKELACTWLFEDELAVYCRAEHPLARKSGVSGEELAAARWIGIGPLYGTRDHMSTLAERQDISGFTTAVDVIGDITLALHLVKTGNYLSFFPRVLMRTLEDRDRFVALDAKLATPKRDVAAWYRSENRTMPTLVAFLERLQTYIRDVHQNG